MRNSHQCTAIALLMSGFAHRIAAGDPGTLDPAFNGSGVVVHEVGGEVTSQVSNVFLLEDGSIVAVGGANTTAALGWPPPRAGVAVWLAPDGKVVTAGRASTGGTETRDVALVRHHIADGTLDNSFGVGGEVTFDIDGDWDRLQSVAITDSGKFVAAGFATTTNDRDFLIVRLEADGTLDTDFGSGGIVVYDFEGAEDRISDLSLLPDGRIMVGGISTSAGGNRRFTVARFLASGALDDTFADDGVALIDIGPFGGGLGAMEIGPDGRIYLAGWMRPIEDLNSLAPVLAVLGGDGTEDPAFGPPIMLDFGSEYPAGVASSVSVDPSLEYIALGGWVGEYDEDDNLEARRIVVARLFGIGDTIFRDRFEE